MGINSRDVFHEAWKELIRWAPKGGSGGFIQHFYIPGKVFGGGGLKRTYLIVPFLRKH